MRIDKFLKISRIIKRRTLAQEACDAGKVLVNGRPVKPSYTVKVGDEAEIRYYGSTLRFRITDIKETVKKDDAASLYEVIGE